MFDRSNLFPVQFINLFGLIIQVDLEKRGFGFGERDFDSMVKFSAEERNGVAEAESSIRSAKRSRYVSDEEDDDVEDIAEDYVNNESSNEEPAGEAVVNEAVVNVSATARDASVSVILMDPEVLDCTICYESLTVPVFQVFPVSDFFIQIFNMP